ncbi:MAG TPA: DUF2946 family protein [Candidatus Dormibacteraeota bacterium]|nr:DUF2946 family protein [Candidatus Dormibacteraeota bacterium]
MLFDVHAIFRRLARPAALTLALLSLAFLLQVTPHAHANGQDEAACGLCQVAHLGVTPAVAVVSVSIPIVSFSAVVIHSVVSSAEPPSGHSSSRAPPLSFAS